MCRGQNKTAIIPLIIGAIVSYILVIVFNALSARGDGVLFLSNQANLSDKYYLEITPAGWTFSIWGFIYTWQALWLLYSFILLFRKTPIGPAYLNPEVVPSSLLAVYILNMLLNIGWLFLFDREIIQAALADIFMMSVTLYICLFLSYRAFDKHVIQLLKEGRRYDIWFIRILLHNGLGIYATWITIATLLNLAHTLTYRSAHDISQDVASTVSLAVLSAEILVFYITDLVVLDRYTRYTVTPYLVLVVALSGSFSKNWVAGARNPIYIAVLLALAATMTIVKLVAMIYRHITQGIQAINIA
ncbi:hypothetical protein CHS0354_016502 [Potamilus streckersoni]|uniref:Uncharacterized protein n=1 Tax=Potamilus streckersoni TaxID=2493646 RepID=A0AAE0SIR2_9BIVA|nr:hypothetical protein CHS0354_016502 [Potamilus streckersoni]